MMLEILFKIASALCAQCVHALWGQNEYQTFFIFCFIFDLFREGDRHLMVHENELYK